MKRLLTTAITVAAATGLIAGTAQAAPPIISREVIDVPPTYDADLSEWCGFDVDYSVQGCAIVRTFEGRTARTVEVSTINAVVTLTGPSGEQHQLRRDVGADETRFARDGTTVTTIAGQVPFQHTGVLRIDLDRDGGFFGPTRGTYEQDLSAACAAPAP